MDPLCIKIIMAIIIFAVAIGGGLPAIVIKNGKGARLFFSYGEALSRGIFLGAGLLHLLPEAQEHFYEVYPNIEYPVITGLCALSVAALLFIEQGLSTHFNKKDSQSTSFLPYILATILSIHSLIAGASLGIDTTTLGFVVIFIAIIAHKGSAAFALGVSMRNNDISKRSMLKIMIFFSLMTPIGVLFGSFLNQMLSADYAKQLESIFDAVAAGTFIYIAAFSYEPTAYLAEAKANRLIGLFIAGILFMGVIAIWL